MRKPKASVIIPVHNEKNNITGVLKKIPKKYEVIVVDDASSDGTADMVKSMGYRPLVLASHSGKGLACMAGAEKASSEYLVFIDGDGQHDPKEIPRVAGLLGKKDLVLGFRNFSTIPIHRRITNKMANFALNLMTGKKFRDVQCGFRGIKKSKLQNLRLGSRGYEFETDMILEACRRNFRIGEVPIKVFYNKAAGNARIGSRMSLKNSAKLSGHLIKKAAEHSIEIAGRKKNNIMKRR